MDEAKDLTATAPKYRRTEKINPIPLLKFHTWLLGTNPEERAHDLVSVYRHYFNNDVQPKNLAKLTEQYIWRDAVELERENNFDGKGDAKTLKVKMFK